MGRVGGTGTGEGVGGWREGMERGVLPLSRAIWFRLNSLARIMGVHDRSTPYS